MSTRNLTTFYFAISIIFIALETIEVVWITIAAKALIIPLLMVLYYRLVRSQMNLFHRLILAALLFSWIGDVTLQLNQFNDIFFMVGLSGFLIAQLIYLSAFFSTRGSNILFFRKFWLIFIVIAYGIGIVWLLFDGLGDMKIPVIAYTIVILTMLSAAINRKEKVNRLSYKLVLIGAMFFILSDSLIAIDKFTFEFPLARIAIMSTYVAAQYLIAVGCLKQFEIKLK
ncbi:MAG: lysoplasmalogenase [Bacteroidales bacterium]|nr:lysoplasmalogenase [Bacteroidales bacterium]